MNKTKFPAFSDIVSVDDDNVLKKHINQLAAKITLKDRLDKYINQRIEGIALETEIMLVDHYLQKGYWVNLIVDDYGNRSYGKEVQNNVIECPHTDGWKAYLNELKNKLDNLTRESLSDD